MQTMWKERKYNISEHNKTTRYEADRQDTKQNNEKIYFDHEVTVQRN